MDGGRKNIEKKMKLLMKEVSLSCKSGINVISKYNINFLYKDTCIYILH